MKRIFACLLALMLAALPLQALAAKIPDPGADFYYLDTADVLSTETEGMIYFCNTLLQEKCGAQIVIAALDSIDGSDIYDYAYDLFNRWGIGSAEENNGFLLLMAIEEDNYYALTGSGIDGVFSSSVLKELNDAYLEPDFAAKDYDAGARKYFSAVLDRFTDYYNLDISVSDGEAAYQAYIRASGTSGFGGANGCGSTADIDWHGDSDYYYYYDEDSGFAGMMLGVIALLFIVSVISKMRGGPFLVWSLIRMLGNSQRGYHHAPRRHHHQSRRPHHGSFGGGFGGGGRSSFSGGRSGFGGARGGGGGSFGGGAGRGRH